LALPKQKIAVRPESEPKLSNLVRKLLREADVDGILPTPLDCLFDVAKVKNIAELPDEEAFLKTLSGNVRSFFISAKQKLRGLADLRERASYVPPDPNNLGRERFAKGHELAHNVIPWHDVDPAYLDDDESLGPSAKGLFEHEANFFSSDVIFQGSGFRTRARDYAPNFNAVFTLAKDHGASRQATAWRFVEEQDEAIALLQYYSSRAIDEYGNPVLAIWRSVGSPEFNRRFSNIDTPQTLRTGHPWVAARDINRICGGNESLPCDGQHLMFEWHSWWNSRALCVLIRRKPMLHVVGSFMRYAFDA
jgi:hypothetical protein